MTQLDKDPKALSNWFDKVLDGIGHRGSSFTNIDQMVVAALTHDKYSRRFLFQEFKHPNEKCPNGQWQALYDLARQPRTTVWLVRGEWDTETVEWTAFREVQGQGLLTAATLTLAEYRQRFEDWWNQTPPSLPPDDGIAPRLIWAEYIKHDPSLQAFVAAELARERIALQTLGNERDHWKQVALSLDDKLQLERRAAKRGPMLR